MRPFIALYVKMVVVFTIVIILFISFLNSTRLNMMWFSFIFWSVLNNVHYEVLSRKHSYNQHIGSLSISRKYQILSSLGFYFHNIDWRTYSSPSKILGSKDFGLRNLRVAKKSVRRKSGCEKYDMWKFRQRKLRRRKLLRRKVHNQWPRSAACLRISWSKNSSSVIYTFKIVLELNDGYAHQIKYNIDKWLTMYYLVRCLSLIPKKLVAYLYMSLGLQEWAPERWWHQMSCS